ncbi:MAG: glycosyltransferase, partial [Planctomycetaceae bacterium]
ISQLDYPRDKFDVIVADDASTTPTPDVVSEFRELLDIHLVVQPRAVGPAAARNCGARISRREYLAFTDDDCAPRTDWLTRIARCLVQNPDAAVGGRILNGLDENVYSTASQLLIEYIYGYFNKQPHDAVFLTSNNFALAAKAFHEIGGFDTRFPRAAAEDRDFCDRWRHHGGRIIYESEATIRHFHAMSFRSFVRQHFNYGRGAFRCGQLRALRHQEATRREPLAFYANLIRSPRDHDERRLRLQALMFITQAANAIGYFATKFAGRSSISSVGEYTSQKTECDSSRSERTV